MRDLLQLRRLPIADDRPPEIRMPTIRDRRQLDLEDAIKRAKAPPKAKRKKREKVDG